MPVMYHVPIYDIPSHNILGAHCWEWEGSTHVVTVVTVPPLIGCVVWNHFIQFILSNSYNVYANPNMDIINSSDDVLDPGIFMSSNCSFEFHINNLCNKSSNLSGWIVIYQLSGPTWPAC